MSGTSSDASTVMSTTSCSGRSCEKPSSSGTSRAIIIGVLIPAGVILLGLGIVLLKVWRRNKKEALEDNDPMFYGETEFLPESELAASYPIKVPGNARYSTHSYNSPSVGIFENPGTAPMSSRASMHTATRPPVNAFNLPEGTNDMQSLRHYARTLHENDSDGYKLASSSTSVLLQRPTSSIPPSARPYLESARGSYMTSHSRMELQTPLTEPNEDLSSLSLMTSKNVVNDPALEYTQFNPSFLRLGVNSDNVSAYRRPGNLSQLSIGADPSVKRASYGHLFQHGSSSADTQREPHLNMAESSRYEKNIADNPHLRFSSYADLDEVVTPIDSIGLYPKVKPEGLNVNGTIKDVPVSYFDNNNDKDDLTNEQFISDMKKDIRHNQNTIQAAVSTEEDRTYHSPLSAEESNVIERMKSIYQVYLDVNGTANKERDDMGFESYDYSYENQVDDYPYPAIQQKVSKEPFTSPVPQNVEPNEGVDRRSRIASSIYSKLPTRPTPSDAYMVAEDRLLPTSPPMLQQTQPYSHPQEQENVEDLPTPSNLPLSTTALSLTSFRKPTQPKIATQAALVQSGLAKTYTPIDRSSPDHIKDPLSQGVFLSNVNNSGTVLPHHLRQSVSMTHPMALGVIEAYKPTGSLRQLTDDSNSVRDGMKPVKFAQPNARVSGLLDFADTAHMQSVGTVIPSARSQSELRKQIGNPNNLSVA